MIQRQKSRLEEPILWLIALMLIGTLLTVDSQLPLGIAGGVPYVIAILFSWLFQSTNKTILISVLCSICVILGYYLSRGVEAPSYVILVNRVLAIIAIIICTLLVVFANKANKGKELLIRELDERISDGIAELEEQMEESQRANNLLGESKQALVSIMEELKESEDRFQLMTKGANVGIWDWIDVNRDEEWWSPKFYELLGYGVGEIDSNLKVFSDLLHPDDKEQTFKNVENHFLNRDPFEVEYRLKTKNEGYKWFYGTGQAVWDDEGKPVRMVGSITDINRQKEFEIDLIEQKNLLNEAQEVAKLGSYEWFPETNTVVWSEQFYKILEISPDDHEGNTNNIFDFVHEDDKDRVMQITEQAVKEKRAIPVEYRLVTKAGNEKYVRGEGHAELNLEGELHRIYGTIQDITERKKAENKFRDLLESAPDAMVIVNENGKIELVNAQTSNIFGFDKDELIGKEVEILMPERYREQHPGHRGGFFTSPNLRPMGAGLELSGLRKNGSEFPIEISLSPIDTAEGKLVSAAIRDITDRKMAEKAIEESNDRLLRKNQELEQFAYIASHDLQEPLRTLSSFVTLLIDKYGGQFDDNGNKFLEYIGTSSNRMRELIKGLLDYSRIGKQSEIESTDINELVSNVIEDLGSSIKDKKAKIKIDPLPTIVCYPMEIRLLFQNLIANAIKFTKNDVKPIIHISSSKNVEYWEFVVSDNGIGMEPKYFNKIFILFQRLSKEHKGTGIGLAHCKKIVDLHNGQISVDSQLGKGSSFKFSVPVNLKG